MNILTVADLPNPEDAQGRSYRVTNAEIKHKYPIGTLVELPNGARLFVVKHQRDCDSTPIYALCADKDDTVQHVRALLNLNWIGGFSEKNLTPVIKPFADPQPEFKKLLKHLDAATWTAGEMGNYYGAFCHGWFGRANEAEYQKAVDNQPAT